jgi:tRNA threonylcarbamoyl adenosine modification protein (Sua5/YciO/YrdC/YwlC family)
MAQYFVINTQNPQARLIKQAVDIIEAGGVVAYPTDSSYALGCGLGHKNAQDAIRRVRGVDDSHLFTLMCRNLSELSTYAKVNNAQFRLLKANTPGPYTFILEASREVPRRLQHAKRSTIGLRVPQHNVVQALLDAMATPLLSMTLQLPEDDAPMSIAWEIRERLEHQIDLVIDSDIALLGESTVVDLTGDSPEIIRQGIGDIQLLGM